MSDVKNKLEIDLAAILERRYPNGFHVPADIDVTSLVEFADNDWTHELDLKQLLAVDRRIALIYSVDDVKQARPGLDNDQAWEVLQQFEAACEDCPEPLCETMRQLADMSYPNGKAALRERLERLIREVDSLPERERDNPAAYGETAAKVDALEAQVKGA